MTDTVCCQLAVSPRLVLLQGLGSNFLARGGQEGVLRNLRAAVKWAGAQTEIFLCLSVNIEQATLFY